MCILLKINFEYKSFLYVPMLNNMTRNLEVLMRNQESYIFMGIVPWEYLDIFMCTWVDVI
jgi:hypothetical protein